jgi:hypothetical protein
VSAAAKIVVKPFFLKKEASFPMVVVFPAPFGPINP